MPASNIYTERERCFDKGELLICFNKTLDLCICVIFDENVYHLIIYVYGIGRLFYCSIRNLTVE